MRVRNRSDEENTFILVITSLTICTFVDLIEIGFDLVLYISQLLLKVKILI